jgi:predicted aspartyl protease
MKKKWIVIFLLLSLSLNGFAQFKNRKSKNEQRVGYFLNNKQGFAKIPFEFQSNLIVVKLRLDDSDTLRLILDTGVSTNIITDLEIAHKMNLQYSRRVKISGAGEGDVLMGSVSIGHTLHNKELVANFQNLVVVDQDVLQLSEYMGMKVHGIFGYDLFSSMVVTIDYESRFLNLYSPEKFKYRKSMGDRYPIVVTQTKPYTDALNLVSNGKTLPMRLVIDTGAGHALLLNANDDKITLPTKVVRANLGRGLNGEINGNIGRVSKVTLGQHEMKNIIASFPDSLSFSMKFIPISSDRQGSIGTELLRRFVVTMNYNEGYMAMKPVKNKLNEAFEYDMSGLEIRGKGEEFNQYFVHKVIPNSPGGEAGIEEGDEVIFVDGTNIKYLNLSDIYKTLSKKEGKAVTMFLRRKGDLKLFSFILRRII